MGKEKKSGAAVKRQNSEKRLQSRYDDGTPEMDKYLSGLSNINCNYVDYVAQHTDLARMGSQQEFETTMDVWQRMHARQCIMHATDSFIKNPVYSLTYSMAMYSCCPSFRKELKSVYGKNAGLPDDVIRDKCIDEAMGSPIGSKERKRYEKMIESGEYGPIPLCESTVALTRIGFMQKAYEDMRKPGANEKHVLQECHDAISLLNCRADADGLDVNLTNDLQKNYMEMLFDRDPKYRRMFSDGFNQLASDNIDECDVSTLSPRGISRRQVLISGFKTMANAADTDEGKQRLSDMIGMYADDMRMSEADARKSLYAETGMDNSPDVQDGSDGSGRDIGPLAKLLHRDKDGESYEKSM